MKLIIIFLTAIFCLNVQAGIWVKGTELKDYTQSWTRQEICEVTPGKCFEISGKDIRHWKLGQVDDLESPKYQKKDLVICSGQEECQTALESLDCASHGEGSFGVIAEALDESYCAVPNGFNQKPGPVVDPSGEAQASSEDASKASEKLARETKRAARVADLIACAKTSGGLSDTDKSSCIKAIAKEMMRTRLNESDL